MHLRPLYVVLLSSVSAIAVIVGSIAPTVTGLTDAAYAAPRAVNPLVDKHITDLDIYDVGGCAATPKGAYCWGGGTNGRIGDGTTVNQPVPVLATGALGVRSISSVSTSATTSCAIASKALYCWGAYPGDGSAFSAVPVAVSVAKGSALAGETTTAVEVPDVGAGGACAVTATGKVACWGSPVNLALSGAATDARGAVSSTIPRSLDSGVLVNKTVTALASTGTVVCAMSTDNQVACWGTSTSGALGTGALDATSAVPAPVKMTAIEGTVFQLLGGDQSFNAALCAATEVSVYCWGKNGIRYPSAWRDWTATPKSIAVNDLSGFTHYQMTINGMCGLRDAQLWCWGRDVQGSSGLDRRDQYISRPTRVNSGTLTDKAIQQISSNGGSLNCAVTAAQRISCWSTESYGNFGNGNSVTIQSGVSTTPLTHTN